MADPMRRELVLASASPFRRRLLEAAGAAFKVAPADVDEPAIRQGLKSADPSSVAAALAAAKAEAVSRKLPQALVIGADQVLALGGDIFSKPRDLADARGQLQQLRGKAHSRSYSSDCQWSLAIVAAQPIVPGRVVPPV